MYLLFLRLLGKKGLRCCSQLSLAFWVDKASDLFLPMFNVLGQVFLVGSLPMTTRHPKEEHTD